MPSSHRYRVGVDIGGTFTDLVAIDEKTGVVSTAKVPTTPDDQSQGFVDALDLSGVDPEAISIIVHGCTVGLNAILTRSGSKIGILTTDGFRDVPAMGRGQRPQAHQFDPRWQRAYGDARDPFVLRFLRRGVRERMSSRGEVLLSLDRDGLMAEVDFLVKHGVAAIAICFINSYANDSHEREAKALVTAEHPQLYCWTSTEVYPIFKEWPRFATTLLNTYIGPLLDRYLLRAEQLLRERGYSRPLMIMQSNGGVLPSVLTRQRPVSTIQSGPTGGVMAACAWARRLAIERLLTLDIGGTSADYAIIEGGQPVVSSELEIEHDVIVALPSVSVHSIGAGGGSIAWIDHLGALRVGPQSAGAVPGPASYGRGGASATVTDALVVTGYIRPERFLNGKMEIYPDCAETALEPIARHLLLPIEAAASSVLDIAVANIVEGAREISVYNGIDPRDFVLYAFGAAGPVFASRIGRELGVRSVLVPPHPGEMCAYGLALADMRIDLGAPLVRRLDALPADEVTSIYDDLERRARNILAEQLEGPLAVGQMTVHRWLDGRYQGQTWDTPSVPVAAGRLSGVTMRELRTNFDRTHQRLWGYALPHIPVKASMARVTAIAALDRPDHEVPRSEIDAAPSTATVRVYNHGWRDVPAIERAGLRTGDVVRGPALLIQPTSTTVLVPGDLARLEEHDHIRITWD